MYYIDTYYVSTPLILPEWSARLVYDLIFGLSKNEVVTGARGGAKTGCVAGPPPGARWQSDARQLF